MLLAAHPAPLNGFTLCVLGASQLRTEVLCVCMSCPASTLLRFTSRHRGGAPAAHLLQCAPRGERQGHHVVLSQQSSAGMTSFLPIIWKHCAHRLAVVPAVDWSHVVAGPAALGRNRQEGSPPRKEAIMRQEQLNLSTAILWRLCRPLACSLHGSAPKCYRGLQLAYPCHHPGHGTASQQLVAACVRCAAHIHPPSAVDTNCSL